MEQSLCHANQAKIYLHLVFLRFSGKMAPNWPVRDASAPEEDMLRLLKWTACCSVVCLLCACGGDPATPTGDASDTTSTSAESSLDPALAQKYIEVELTTDTSVLTEKEKQMIPLLIETAEIMDDLFWQQAYGDKSTLLDSIDDPATREFAKINYGPWDRLNGNKPFIDGVEAKPKGAQFYPADVDKQTVEAAAADNPDLLGLYTMVRRDADGNLTAIPYHEFFAKELQQASDLLTQAAALAEDEGLKKYLELRAQALLDSNYRPSDMAWMDMKSNTIDFVVGPIEMYEDQMFNAKTAFEAYILVKDKTWSERLSRYAAMLPELQRGLPVDDAYKQEEPGTDSDLNAYDVVYYAGDCNAGSKTIAINLPNDETVQLEKGTRRLQLKNAMRAKFDKILVPISEVLIHESQRQHITFDAFFANTMFHEVAHGLGIKNTVADRSISVRKALAEQSSALEEGKADVLGLYMIKSLMDKGELTGNIEDYYVTFFASIFRSIRFGSSSAHGRANLLRFNYFKDLGAFERDPESNTYRVNFDKMDTAVGALSREILTLQGDGNYDGVVALMNEKAVEGQQLRSDLDRLEAQNIPTDIVFKQGLTSLGLQ